MRSTVLRPIALAVLLLVAAAGHAQRSWNVAAVLGSLSLLNSHPAGFSEQMGASPPTTVPG